MKHVRRRNIDLEKVWDVESATGKGVLYVTRSKNETSKRPIPLNQAARGAVERMLKRADDLGHTDPEHYVWCAGQHHKSPIRGSPRASGTAPGDRYGKQPVYPDSDFTICGTLSSQICWRPANPTT